MTRTVRQWTVMLLAARDGVVMDGMSSGSVVATVAVGGEVVFQRIGEMRPKVAVDGQGVAVLGMGVQGRCQPPESGQGSGCLGWMLGSVQGRLSGSPVHRSLVGRQTGHKAHQGGWHPPDTKSPPSADRGGAERHHPGRSWSRWWGGGGHEAAPLLFNSRKVTPQD